MGSRSIRRSLIGAGLLVAVGEFTAIVGPNNRPVQSLNAREVLRDES